MKPKVSVVIPNYNGKEYLMKCVQSLMKQDARSFEIIIVDDCSSDTAMDDVRGAFGDNDSGPALRYITHQTNKGFCESVNDGIIAARTEYVLLLNNDTEVETDFVRNMYNAIKRSDRVFSVSAKMVSLHDKNVIDDSGDLYCSLGWAFTPGKDKNVSKYNKRARIFAGCGGACIYRRKLLLELGLFDVNHFAYLEDIDIGFRAKWHGYINLYEPTAICYHAGSASSGSRYNQFKIRLAAQNSIYLIYKNMPLWMKVFNSPQLLAGIFIKWLFFSRKHFGQDYIYGVKAGISLAKSEKGKNKKIDFKNIPFTRQLLIEAELLLNTVRRVVG